MKRKIVNKFNFKSLQWQLLSRFFLILIVLLFIMGLSQYLTTKNYLYKSKAEILSARFHDIDLKFLMTIKTTEAIKEKSSYIINELASVNISVAIIDKNGTSLADSKDFINVISEKPFRNDKRKYRPNYITSIPKLSINDYTQVLNEYGNIEKLYKLVKDDNGNLHLVMWRKIGSLDYPSGLIQLSTPAQDAADILKNQIYIYIGVSILILIIGAILGGTVFKQTLNPLYNMTRTIEEININQLHTRLPENTGQSEIDRLSNSFNNMLQRIENSFEKEQAIKEKMRQFVSNASHELRTPLTSIHGFVEVLLMGAAKNEKQLDLALNSILVESERLTKLVNDLLMLTKLEQQVSVEMNTENINNVINEVFPQLQILSGKRKIQLQLEDNIKVNINKDQIKQVIFNLVQNAIQHTDKNTGIITISTSIDSNFAVLEIKDNGTGISEKHLNQIFDRFFRSESHRSREHGGYGLGLSIVKSIIDAHEGKITVKSSLGIGTTFSIYLKLIK
ncbi:HAMP domain-containing histidine kinase [Clostridium sp. SYSU_GA19001]|uniref:sensor histidine kinase n=1 Tax=Clostridium caldaquaticum TaxID=2940653 RepID=UPI002077716E|nr:HAMP domain-containing sensor histidine kinase [Clostridium caldaquaticum]MCM8711915.1 HAMP domain-containing histidine kinase [Clostridium caldaquaticum]